MTLSIILLTLLQAGVPSSGGSRSVTVGSGSQWAPSETVVAPQVNGAVILRDSTSNVTIGPAIVSSAYRAIETSANSVVRELRIRGLRASNLQRDGIRLRNASNVEIAHFFLAMRTEPQTSPHLPEGIAITAGSSINIHDGTISGFRMVSRPGRYTNGDGIALEGHVRDVRISRVNSFDNSDAGFDLKSKNTRLDDTVARNNSRNYRLWGTGTAGTITSIDPRGVHINIKKDSNWHISRLIVRSKSRAPIVYSEGHTGILVIDSCDLHVPAGTPLKAGSGTISFGKGCVTS